MATAAAIMTNATSGKTSFDLISPFMDGSPYYAIPTINTQNTNDLNRNGRKNNGVLQTQPLQCNCLTGAVGWRSGNDSIENSPVEL